MQFPPAPWFDLFLRRAGRKWFGALEAVEAGATGSGWSGGDVLKSDSAVKNLYPMEFSLHRLRRSWGGWPEKVGEILSLSGPPLESIVLNGTLAGSKLTEVVGRFQQRLLGEGVELDPRESFPMLLRFIRAGEDLSARVHPDDAYTIENGLPGVGTDKLWFILDAEQGGFIRLGFRRDAGAGELRGAVGGGTLGKLLNSVPVRPGDVFSIPARRIHAIGKGVTLVEIQNHSHLVFPVPGLNPAEQEVISSGISMEETLKILDLRALRARSIPGMKIPLPRGRIEYLALTPRFFLRRIMMKGELDISCPGDRVAVYTGLRGSGWVRWGFSGTVFTIQPYQSVVVPAIPEELFFESEEGLEVLETSIPNFGGSTSADMVGRGIQEDRIALLGGDDYGQILLKCME